jgi:DUF4097 and DUF4098 domain-containing protein YvlB/uncharacterized membrane protein HdeD (DUF308 family)
MLKRCTTLVLGVALVGLGVLFFVIPDRSQVVQLLVRFWPLFLILAGVVRIAGHLIDRQPRSPLGGFILTALGSILLAANLRGQHSFLQIFGHYWFWLLLALIAGRVIQQYTHRPEDGPRPPTFSFGLVLLMILIIGGGLLAGSLEHNQQLLSRWHTSLSRLSGIGDYLLGDKLTVEDEPAQLFDMQPYGRLLVSNGYGDVEVRSTTQMVASARLLQHIRAMSEEDARQFARRISMQITTNGNLYQLAVQAEPLGVDFHTTLMVELPAHLQASVEVDSPSGQVKFFGLRGDHIIRNSDQVEVSNNAGRVTVEHPRGTVQLRQIQGDVSVIGARRSLTLQEITGHLFFESQSGEANIRQIRGQVKGQINNGRLELADVRPWPASMAANWTVHLEGNQRSRLSVRDIEGSVMIAAERSDIEAREIKGNLAVNSSFESVRFNRIAGQVQVKAENAAVAAEELSSAATIEATRDVVVRNFYGPLKVTTQSGDIRLSTNTALGGDVAAVSQRGKIQVSLPSESSFRLEASTTFGQLRFRGFRDLDLPRQQKEVLITYNSRDRSVPLLSLRSTNGDIYLRVTGLTLARNEEQEGEPL